MEHLSFPCGFIVRRRVNYIGSSFYVVRDKKALFEFTGDRGNIDWKSEDRRRTLISPSAGASGVLLFINMNSLTGFCFEGVNFMIGGGEYLVPGLGDMASVPVPHLLS
jgi:hypothetical protein